MKTLLVIFTSFCVASLASAEDSEKKAMPPKRELSITEKKFLGKWSGSRSVYKWEIDRKADRTFEIAFVEPDPDRFLRTFKNYATGVWWIEGKEYKFEWTKWWGDEGDLGGLQTEIVDAVEDNKVITLSDDDEDPKNIEVRTEKFKLSAWKLKPLKQQGEQGSADQPATAPESKPEGNTEPEPESEGRSQ
ncbi:MAG: hypothetical protein ACSHYF_15550 [Verrucomicrobiaceae bacterium]